jgi:ribose 5-phosphate isomerase B
VRFVIAGDHNGVALKAHLIRWLTQRGHHVTDRGAHGPEAVDYPELCADVGRRVVAGEADFGIVTGGSGQGEVIACNKIHGVRAGLCHTEFATQISRGHNDANVMVLGAKVLSDAQAEEMLEVWLATPFKGGQHQIRLDQIEALERDG